MSRLAAVVATLLAVVLLGAAVWAQAPRDVVVVGMEAEPPGLDPGQALGVHTLRVTAEIFETLVATPDDSTEVIPGLAESWTTSSDGLTWTFKLRKGVRFHDGTALDAAAVKFTFDRVIDPAQPHAKSGKWSFVTGYLSSVKSVETLDPQTVQLHLKYPTSSLLALLALPNCAIVSPTAFTKAPADFDTKPVGSGRYKFESWERGSRLVLRRNDDYWGDKGKPQTLVYRGIAEANARVTELLTGGVDLILPIPARFRRATREDRRHHCAQEDGPHGVVRRLQRREEALHRPPRASGLQPRGHHGRDRPRHPQGARHRRRRAAPARHVGVRAQRAQVRVRSGRCTESFRGGRLCERPRGGLLDAGVRVGDAGARRDVDRSEERRVGKECR